MDEIGPGQIELKVHGLVSEDHGRVPARVFANKLKQFVMALEAADAFANGSPAHTYILSSMHMSQPTAVVSEVLIHTYDTGRKPAFPVFCQAIEAIKDSSIHDDALGRVVEKVNLLASGAESKFGFAEVRDASTKIIRIDSFLKNRAYAARWQDVGLWYSGISYGSYDGFLKYVDTRGSFPEIKLQLTAGGKEINCVCRREDIDALGASIEKRVRVYGKCIYGGANPLPLRIEVSTIESVHDPSDFSRWNGAFRPFQSDDWEELGTESDA